MERKSSLPCRTALDPADYRELIEHFLKEDLGVGDLTTEATVHEGQRALGRIVAKAPLVLAGCDVAVEVFRLLDSGVSVEAKCRDGDRLRPGDEPAIVAGRARALLSGERLALNILQRLAGIATLTRQFVDAVAGTAAKILDTRKTTPGLRSLEKYAVTVGGGYNHRRDLGDAILIKENHIRMAGGVKQALEAVKAQQSRARFVEIEVTTIEELDQALSRAPDVILLDNMTPGEVREAVQIVGHRKIILEASGGITLLNARAYAEAGADWISVGALTHSAPAADLSLEIEPLNR